MVSRLAAVRGANVELVWGVDDPHDLEKQVPRLHLLEDIPFLTMPELVLRMPQSRLSRGMYELFRRLPFYPKLVRHLHYAFSGDKAAKA